MPAFFKAAILLVQSSAVSKTVYFTQPLPPVARAPRTVGRAKTLRYDAFGPELARVAKHDLARLVDVLVEH